MRPFLAAGMAAASALAIGVTGMGTASAQPVEYEMPSYEGMSLAQAKESFSEMTGGLELGTKVVNTLPQIPMNPESWMVCGQKPAPGVTITKSSSAAVAVAPPGMCNA